MSDYSSLCYIGLIVGLLAVFMLGVLAYSLMALSERESEKEREAEFRRLMRRGQDE